MNEENTVTLQEPAIPAPIKPRDPYTPCEVCGKMVSTNPLGRKKHMSSHDIKTDANGAIPLAERPIPEGLSADEIADIKYARTIQQRRRSEAPVASTSLTSVGSMMKQIEARLRAESILTPTDHAFFGDEKKHRSYLSKGYEPVYENGRQVFCEGLLLYRMDEKVYRAHEAAGENLAKKTLKQQLVISDDRKKAMGLGGESERSSLESRKDISDLTEENANGSNIDQGESALGG